MGVKGIKTGMDDLGETGAQVLPTRHRGSKEKSVLGEKVRHKCWVKTDGNGDGSGSSDSKSVLLKCLTQASLKGWPDSFLLRVLP